MSAETLERAFASTHKVLANVSADHLDQPTPCTNWKVRDLINHIVGGTYFFAVGAETGEAPMEPNPPDFSEGDFVGTFAEGSARAVQGFQQAAPDKPVKLPWGEMPAGAFSLLASTDTFTHAWDLARATGQDTDLDAELAEQLLGGARQMVPDAFRSEDGAVFKPATEAPEDASAADRLAAFMGRDV
jgi:uncharacterized protein (TIGR03086 family)